MTSRRSDVDIPAASVSFNALTAPERTIGSRLILGQTGTSAVPFVRSEAAGPLSTLLCRLAG